MADKSSLIKDAVVDLQKFKNEAVELAKKEVISQTKNEIEERAKKIFEQLLFESEGEESEGSSEKSDDSEFEVEITIPTDSEGSEGTYIDPSHEYDFAEDEEGHKENEDTMENNIENEVNMVDSPDMDAIIKEFLDMADEDEVSVEAGAEGSGMEGEVYEQEVMDIEGLESVDAEIEAADEYAPTDDAPTEFSPLSEEEIADLEKQLDEELARLDEELEGLEEGEDCEDEDKEDDSKEDDDKPAFLKKKEGEKEVIDEEEEVLPEGEESEEEPIEEASMQSTTHLRHKNLKPVNVEKKADSLNEAKELYAKLTAEVNKLINESKEAKAGLAAEAAKNEELKKLNESLSGKLKEVTGKLYEASVITAKTAYVNRLFLEHTTTQEQKKNIVTAFNKAQSREEVKTLFESYNTSLTSGVLNEGIENKISKVINEGTSQQNTGIVHGVDVSRYKRIIDYRPR